MKNELIEEIRMGIDETVYTYPEGAWDNFKKQRRQRRCEKITFFMLPAAAVLLLMAFPVFLGPHFKIKPVYRHLSTSTREPAPKMIRKLNGQPAKKATSIKVKHISTPPAPLSTIGIHADTIMNDIASVQPPGINTLPARKNNITRTVALRKNTTTTVANEQESHFFRYCLFFAQDAGNIQKNGTAFGASVLYKLRKNISISSGIAYNPIAVNKNSGNNFSGKEKNIISSNVSASLSGIDWSLELQYMLGKKLYANAGLSAYAILHKEQHFHYKYQSTPYLELGGNNGEVRPQTVAAIGEASRPLTHQEKDNRSYIGFYNLSAGYQLRITRSAQIGIEPYLKIPMTGYTQKNLDLTQQGLRIRMSF